MFIFSWEHYHETIKRFSLYLVHWLKVQVRMRGTHAYKTLRIAELISVNNTHKLLFKIYFQN